MATNTTKDLIIGRIYEIHQSIRNAFNLESNEQTANYSSTNSSVTTASSESASSARKKKLRPFTRSCLLWGQNQDHCIVLLITTFNDTDPVNNNQVAESFGMKKDELLKRLIPIHKTKPITGQFSIQFQQMPSIHDKLDPNKESYLLLIPVVVSRQIHWPEPTQTTFRCNDLLVINKVLTDLSREATQLEEISFLKKEIERLKRENERLKNENERLKKEEISKNEENELANEKKEIEIKRTEIEKKKEETDRMILLLYGQGRLDEVEAEHDDHQTSLHSSIPEPLFGNIWESQEVHNNIFSSDEDDYSSNDEDSPMRTKIMIRENIITDEKSSFINDIEEWLNRNTFMNDISIDNEVLKDNLSIELDLPEMNQL